jgi:hypothetical protein
MAVSGLTPQPLYPGESALDTIKEEVMGTL